MQHAVLSSSTKMSDLQRRIAATGDAAAGTVARVDSLVSAASQDEQSWIRYVVKSAAVVMAANELSQASMAEKAAARSAYEDAVRTADAAYAAVNGRPRISTLTFAPLVSTPPIESREFYSRLGAVQRDSAVITIVNHVY